MKQHSYLSRVNNRNYYVLLLSSRENSMNFELNWGSKNTKAETKETAY